MTASLTNNRAVSRKATRKPTTARTKRAAPSNVINIIDQWHAQRLRSITVADVKLINLPFVWTANHDLAFPDVTNNCEPFGSRILLQLRVPKRKTASGLIIPIDSRDTENDITQVGMIRAVGPLAFCNRKTRQPWPEGMWAKPGDFVRCAKYGGDRWTVDHRGTDGEIEKVHFVIFNDLDLIGRWNADPLSMVAYV